MASKIASPQVIERPKEVEYAIKLLLTALVFGVIVGYVSISEPPDHKYFMVYSDLIILGLLFNGYFAYKISQNRNWARKFYISFTFLSLLFYISQLTTQLNSTPMNGILQGANILIQLAAVYFLLKKPSKDWFELVSKEGKP